MTAEQKKMIRENAQSILDLADARLKDDRVTDVNVRHDLELISGMAQTLLVMVEPRKWPWE